MRNQVLMQAYAPLRRGDKYLLQNPILRSIGQKHRKSTAQVALRWQLDRLVPVVVKSSKPNRINSNFDIFDFKLSSAEMALMDRVRQKSRLYDLPGTKSHPDYPFSEK